MIKIIMDFFRDYFKDEKELGGGLLGIGEHNDDFLLGGTDVHRLIKNSSITDRQVKYEYNQGAEYETRNWCTVYSAVTEVSYLMDYEFKDCEIKEIGRLMVKEGKLDPNMGAYLHDAVDYVRRYWNKTNPTRKIVSYRIDYTDLDLRRTLKNTRVMMTQLGYKTSTELHNDCQDDGHADKSIYPKKGGHAVSKWGVWIIDNYKGKLKRNKYNFKQFDELIANGVIFRNGYIFLKDIG